MVDSKPLGDSPIMEISSTPTYLLVLIALSTVSAVLAGVYFSGYADDAIEFVMKKIFKAKAKAEMLAMETAGEGKAQDFLKGQLKKNPVVSPEELDQVSDGLGGEKLEEFSKGGGFAKGLKI